eukprot:scaffold65833_cov42-Phaeocystis_antarctica.AAC.3
MQACRHCLLGRVAKKGQENPSLERHCLGSIGRWGLRAGQPGPTAGRGEAEGGGCLGVGRVGPMREEGLELNLPRRRDAGVSGRDAWGKVARGVARSGGLAHFGSLVLLRRRIVHDGSPYFGRTQGREGLVVHEVPKLHEGLGLDAGGDEGLRSGIF